MPMPNHCVECDKPALVTHDGVPYCIKHWREKEKEVSNDKDNR